MRRFYHLLIFLLLLSPSSILSQERLTSISITGSLSTISELFHHPNDPDQLLRSEYYPLNVIIGGGIEIRQVIPQLRFSVGASVERLSKSGSFSVNATGFTGGNVSKTVNVPVSDGYTVLPAELSIYVPLPIGTDDFQVYIGGGGGAYFGNRHYSYGNIDANTTDLSAGFGIHILSGFEYRFSTQFSLRTEFKFRDVHFETTSAFPDQRVDVEGVSITLPQGSQDARINIDGFVTAIQLAYHF